jgi:hypothetical protein
MTTFQLLTLTFPHLLGLIAAFGIMFAAAITGRIRQ